MKHATIDWFINTSGRSIATETKTGEHLWTEPATNWVCASLCFNGSVSVHLDPILLPNALFSIFFLVGLTQHKPNTGVFVRLGVYPDGTWLDDFETKI